MMSLRRMIIYAWEMFEMFEKDNPNISTERLMAMVCDFTGADPDYVAEVLASKWD